MKVLVIEDEPAVGYFLQEVVETLGHQCFLASDGEIGFAKFQEENPDLIFSDYQLPKVSGLDLLKKVREEDSGVIFVLMTGHGSEEFAASALRLQANNYLQKPIRFETLVQLLNKYEENVKSMVQRDEIRRMVFHRELELSMGNKLEMVADVVSYLVEEASPWISKNERFGVQLGLYELIVNAIEHGNLAVTFQDKNKLLQDSLHRYQDLIKKRLVDPVLASRRVTIRFSLKEDHLEWLISDEGIGFDWYAIPSPLEGTLDDKVNGRGIYLARFQFDELKFLGAGNKVLLTKKLGENESKVDLENASNKP